MEIASVVEEFEHYLIYERAYSPLTVYQYRSDVIRWCSFVEQEGLEPTLASISPPLVRKYMTWVAAQGMKSQTVHRRISSLRSFWRFLTENEYAEGDPFSRLRMPKRVHQVPAFLTEQECRRLLEAAEKARLASLAFRDKAILSTFIFTGIRRAELLSLRLTDIDLEAGILRVMKGKGNKSRVLPLIEPCRSTVADWLEIRPKKGRTTRDQARPESSTKRVLHGSLGHDFNGTSLSLVSSRATDLSTKRKLDTLSSAREDEH